MARSRRIRLAGVSQHVTQRGTDRTAIFRCDSDYHVFLTLMRETSTRRGLDVHGYVLMNNHIHVLATPQTLNAVERTMQRVGSLYVRYFNKRHGRTGTLFEGRYKASIVDDERYWITCLRYIELNPVRAGIVGNARDYPWSSHKGNAFGVTDPLLTPHRRYLNLGDDEGERQRTWRSMCDSDLSSEELDWIRFSALERRVVGLATQKQ